jgi:hypothetical protein
METYSLEWNPQQLSSSGTGNLSLLTQETEGNPSVIWMDPKYSKELSHPRQHIQAIPLN